MIQWYQWESMRIRWIRCLSVACLQDGKPVQSPASSDPTKLEIEAEPVEQLEELEQLEPEVNPESGKSEESKARGEISPSW